jgi:hypothetical protein
MNRFFFPAILGAVLFVSCAGIQGRQGGQIDSPPETIEIVDTPESFIITDFRNYSGGGFIPEWVSRYLDGGVREHEAMDEYQGFHVFVSRNEGTNFNALKLWTDGFSPELDFPRLAAARIEARFGSSVPHPGNEYGAFYESLVRTASDFQWTGMWKEDDFWIRRQYPGGEEEDERETWEFLILVIIEKNLFASQLDTVFKDINPSPQPSKDQITAANRVKDRFFEGF